VVKRDTTGTSVSPPKDLPVAPTSGVDIDVPEGTALGPKASPPPSRRVGLPLGLPGLGAEVALPRSTIISLELRGQALALSFGSTELP
jgi:hypothetical protein